MMYDHRPSNVISSSTSSRVMTSRYHKMMSPTNQSNSPLLYLVPALKSKEHMHTVAKERMSSVAMITGILSLALLFLVPTIIAHVHEASSDLKGVLPNPIHEVTDMDDEGVIDDLRRVMQRPILLIL
jgi:hypothetical protein